jgi:spermidine/putrescine-binding protein
VRRSVKVGVLFAAGLSALLMAGGASTHPTGGSASCKGRVIIAEFGGAYSASIRNTLANPFSAASGCKALVVDTTDRVQKPLAMIKAHRVQWDIVEAVGVEAAQLQSKGALQPIPKATYNQLKKALNPGTVTPYGVSISSYTYLWACNKDTVKKCPENAAEFFDTQNFPGRRTVNKDDWLDNIVIALEADGVPANKLFPLDVNRALKKWASLKSQIAVYFTSGDQWQQLFRDKEVDMGMGPDGRTWNLVDQGLNLDISYQGVLYQNDYFVVLKHSPNPAGAFAFMSWYATHPSEQANFAAQQLYGMPNPKVYKYVSPKVAKQLVDFPPNKKQTYPIDLKWVNDHGVEAAKAWSNFLAG